MPKINNSQLAHKFLEMQTEKTASNIYEVINWHLQTVRFLYRRLRNSASIAKEYGSGDCLISHVISQ